MIEQGKVIRVTDNKTVVMFKAREFCRHCFSRESCNLSGEGPRQMEVSNEIGAVPGDTVEVEIKERNLGRKYVLLFITPSIFFITGITFSSIKRFSDLNSLGIGLVCLIISFAGLSIIDRYYYGRRILIPKIVKLSCPAPTPEQRPLSAKAESQAG